MMDDSVFEPTGMRKKYTKGQTMQNVEEN